MRVTEIMSSIGLVKSGKQNGGGATAITIISNDHLGFCILSHQQGLLLLLLLVELDDLHQLALLHIHPAVHLVHPVHLLHLSGTTSKLPPAQVSHNGRAKSVSKNIHCCSDPVDQPDVRYVTKNRI